jgi:hypothetical protein
MLVGLLALLTMLRQSDVARIEQTAEDHPVTVAA